MRYAETILLSIHAIVLLLRQRQQSRFEQQRPKLRYGHQCGEFGWCCGENSWPHQSVQAIPRQEELCRQQFIHWHSEKSDHSIIGPQRCRQDDHHVNDQRHYSENIRHHCHRWRRESRCVPSQNRLLSTAQRLHELLHVSRSFVVLRTGKHKILIIYGLQNCINFLFCRDSCVDWLRSRCSTMQIICWKNWIWRQRPTSMVAIYPVAWNGACAWATL